MLSEDVVYSPIDLFLLENKFYICYVDGINIAVTMVLLSTVLIPCIGLRIDRLLARICYVVENTEI